MATPFNDNEIAQIKEIFGLPQTARAVVLAGLSYENSRFSNSWEPLYSVGTFTNALAQLTAQLELVTAAAAVRARIHLVQWDAITGTSPMRLTASASGDSGTVVDHERERENIRMSLANILGFTIPTGGFAAENQRRERNCNLGDR